MATLTTNVNYLQPTGFSVTINRENYPNLEYFAQSVQHPSIDVSAVEMPFRRVNAPIVGDKMQFGQVSFNFLIDEEMNTYNEIYDWMKRFVESPQVTSTDAFRDTSIPTESDITVSILSSHNNVVKQIKYYSAFPVSIGDIEFTTQSGDVAPMTFNAAFRFVYFEIV